MAVPLTTTTSSTMDANAEAGSVAGPGETTLFAVLLALAASHLMNDTVQSLLPAIYPIIRQSFHLNFGQIGIITLAFQVTASLLQPLVGLSTDRHPRPYSLPIGMGATLMGLLLLSVANRFSLIVLAAALVGVGSSVFHPEASRVARMAAGGRHGMAQALFQVGGNTGAATGPLLAAFIIVPHGQRAIAWLSLVPLIGIGLLIGISNWYAAQIAGKHPRARR
ncbi:MAG: MFS transporter, partial [Xanthobacteraceae bacterium]